MTKCNDRDLLNELELLQDLEDLQEKSKELRAKQKTRVVNLRNEPYDVYIGRGSKWGNPFSHIPSKVSGVIYVGSREEAISRYAAYIRENPSLMNSLVELKGKRLGCYCKPLPCHGDILVELVEAL
jgi:hypothetical protein